MDSSVIDASSMFSERASMSGSINVSSIGLTYFTLILSTGAGYFLAIGFFGFLLS
jgi:hypothetical protein